jgi:hypothetical protein
MKLLQTSDFSLDHTSLSPATNRRLTVFRYLVEYRNQGFDLPEKVKAVFVYLI